VLGDRPPRHAAGEAVDRNMQTEVRWPGRASETVHRVMPLVVLAAWATSWVEVRPPGTCNGTGVLLDVLSRLDLGHPAMITDPAGRSSRHAYSQPRPNKIRSSPRVLNSYVRRGHDRN
jgi:hypothetical protein